ncbi:uncharacterized protein OCT59_011891 [Rhizophagus irregularis]|uniref:uncharacterized protein n=1 Tax=Rhizophagus irregularis TaxID=588596 RepID=UPI003330D1B8|nr:hypothetical protein OCT59_011891 [Rhizophagus irregularis]
MNIQTLFDTLDVHIEGSVDDTIRKQYQIGDNDDSVITGFDDISLQYSEAQGKYAGLCIIEAYHKSRNILHDRLPICVKLHILVVKFGGDKCIASFSSSDILSISWIYRTIQKKTPPN